MLTFALVVFVAVAGSARGDDACAPTPGQKRVHPDECCKVASIAPSSMKAAFEKCKQKYPMGKPPGPPPSGPPTGPPPTPSAEVRASFTALSTGVYCGIWVICGSRKTFHFCYLLVHFNKKVRTLEMTITVGSRLRDSEHDMNTNPCP